MNERRLAKLEQFADTQRRESIADNKALINERKMFLELLQVLDKRSRCQSVRHATLEVIVESLIAAHPDRDAVKISFQKRIAAGRANFSDGSFEQGIPVVHTHEMNQQLDKEVAAWLALFSR